jgi:hypothetical protein
VRIACKTVLQKDLSTKPHTRYTVAGTLAVAVLAARNIRAAKEGRMLGFLTHGSSDCYCRVRVGVSNALLLAIKIAGHNVQSNAECGDVRLAAISYVRQT